MALRPVVVDDTDPRIQYTGSWSVDTSGSQDKFGTYGQTYNHTLHSTGANDSFVFSFTGSTIRVFGTVNLGPTYGGYSGVAGPNFIPPWQCLVDNVSIGATKPSPFHENNQLLCDGGTLNNGAHELKLQIQNMTAGTIFWVDYLEYTPSQAPNSSAVVLVENTDPSITYDSSWTGVDGIANMTSTHGASVRFSFTGTQLTWMGYIPIELPGNGTSASYSIDNGPPTNFFLVGHAPFDGTSIFNQVFFTTPLLSNTPHSIVVTHNGSADYTPLTLDYIYLTVDGPGSSSGSGSGGTPQAGKSTQKPIGAIVGGVVGGCALIALLLLAYFFFKRRRGNKGTRDPQAKKPPRGVSTVPVPFTGTTPAQPASASTLSPLSPLDSGTLTSSGGFVSGVMAQVGDTKRAGGPVTVLPQTPAIASSTSSSGAPHEEVAAPPPEYYTVV